jgi:hypothetical protein
MQFRQQRRRRVWPDEASATAAAPTAERPGSKSAGSGEPAETYTEHARRDAQPRLTDLIPVRYRTLTLLYLGGACLLGVLECLYARLDSLAVHVAREALGVFDLANRGSFAAWYSSLLLSLTAATAGLLFSLRRHRIDDYRGRYRIWIWGTLGLLLLAINQTSHVDDLVRQLATQAAASAGIQAGWMWPALCLTVALAALARISFEMRPSRGSLALVWLGAGSWLLSASDVVLNLADPAAQVMLAVGLKVLGQLTLLAAHVAYARYVLLDAHGLLAARVRPPRAKATAVRRKRSAAVAEVAGPRLDAPKTASTARTDLDPPTLSTRTAGSTPVTETMPSQAAPKPVPAKPAAAKLASPPANRESDDVDDEADDSSDEQGLTRAERKRLRRERKGDRRNAA